ncbi:MAG: hypothetical protein WC349_01845 [Patescibacteria group bacterium]|jgi:hypothetical protein
MEKQNQAVSDDAWSYTLKEGAYLCQIIGINGGCYLPVGEFKKKFFKGMSSSAFIRLDDGTFALCSFHEENLKQMKICGILTSRDFRGYLAKIDLFFEKQNELRKKKIKSAE